MVYMRRGFSAGLYSGVEWRSMRWLKKSKDMKARGDELGIKGSAGVLGEGQWVNMITMRCIYVWICQKLKKLKVSDSSTSKKRWWDGSAGRVLPSRLMAWVQTLELTTVEAENGPLQIVLWPLYAPWLMHRHTCTHTTYTGTHTINT